MKIRSLLILLLSVCTVHGQEPMTTVPLDLRIESTTLFVDVLAEARVFIPASIAWPDEQPLPDDTDAISFLREESQPLDKGCEWILHFLPRRTGFVIFPALRWELDGKHYQTEPQQVQVRSLQNEPAMQLDIKPVKTTVTVGEPLRMDVTWHCKLPAASLKQLSFHPAFFYQAGIDLDIPRPLVPEEKQVGLPVGGRRIIAERIPGPGDHLGTVRFSIFVRFSEAGRQTIEPVRLKLFQLLEPQGQFAPYASYFNNSLFERRDPARLCNYIFTESPAFTVTVLPLPEEGKRASFSNLYAPCRIEASIQPETGDVGQLMELSLRVYSGAPYNFLTLPDLTQQASLRHRFWIEREARRMWQPDGAEFLFRFRALTTSIHAFPALSFQVFDPNTSHYLNLQTQAIPLVIHPKDGQTFLRRDLLLDKSANLTDAPAGIWHNKKAHPMSDLMNSVVNTLADSFWLWIMLAPILFIALRPWVLRRRRRALDPIYRKRIEAYERFCKCPETDPQKHTLFRSYLAAIGNQASQTYTVGDALDMMSHYPISDEDIQAVRTLFEAEDAAKFNRQKTTLETPALNSLAKRIFRSVDKATKTIPIILLTVLMLSGNVTQAANASVHQDPWSRAEDLFAQAHQAEAGSPAAIAAYAEAALLFESVAKENLRPGLAWYNAGNAWFEGGQLGRSIAAYLHAQAYRPFDAKVKLNLDTARALTQNRVSTSAWYRWFCWPLRWLKALFVIIFVLQWGLVLLHLRYRRRWSLAANIGITLILAFCLGLMITTKLQQGKQGVVIAEEIIARKGPGYNYNSAFQGPLYSGLECEHLETRDTWCRIRLHDGRECWVPERQMVWILLR